MEYSLRSVSAQMCTDTRPPYWYLAVWEQRHMGQISSMALGSLE